MKRLAGGGKAIAPAAVEAAYKRLIKDREIRANLEAIRGVGGAVDYRAIDVRDTAAFGGAHRRVERRRRHRRRHSRRRRHRGQTAPRQDARIVRPRLRHQGRFSALTLARKLDPARLEFFALFASITSRYGNRGQSDYAAANEVLSKLACDLDRNWPGRVVSIAWGPWAEVGMVADLEKHSSRAA